MSSQQGFTLLEVLVAVMIIAIALIPLQSRISSYANTNYQLEMRTVAGWVANNLMTETRLQGPQAVGEQKGKVEMARQDWYWQRKISGTDDPLIRRIDIEVRRKDDAELPLFSLIGYVGPR